MNQKTGKNAEFVQLLETARAAQEDRQWQAAIERYTAALETPGLSLREEFELREHRAQCYAQLGDLESQIDDLLRMNRLLADQGALQTEALARGDKVQAALYQIADAASAGLDLQAFYARVHEIVGELMYAENFFIALYDETTKRISWPYFVDSVDLEAPEPRLLEDHPIRGGTALVLLRGQPVHSPRENSEERFMRGEIVPVGTVAEDWIGIPLEVEGKTIGVVVVQSYLEGVRYTDDDFQLLIFVARHIATALERARAIDETRRLLAETEARRSELAVINSIQAGLAEQLDFQAIVNLVGDKLREVLQIGNVSIAWLDHERMMGVYLYAYVDGERVELEPWKLGPTGRTAVQDRQPILWRTPAEAEEKGLWTREGEKEALSGLFVPISGRARAIGAIRLEDYETEFAFDETVLRLVSTIAASMGIALENARLFDEVQSRNAEISLSLERQTATSAVLHAMANSPSDLKPLLVAIAENAARLCEADDVQIYRVDGDLLRQIAHHGPLPALKDDEALPLVPGLMTGRAVLEKRTIYAEDVGQLDGKDYPDSVALQRRLGHRTSISTPMLREGAAIGAIVVRRNEVRPFSERQIALLSTFADQAAIALDNVRLFTETQERNAELAIINSVGEAMARKLDVDTVVGIVGDRVQEIFRAEVVMIGLVDEAAGVMQVPYLHKEGDRFKAQPIPLGTGMVAHVMDAREPAVFGTYEDQFQAGAVAVEAEGTEHLPYESWMGVPIIVGDRVIGAVAVQNMVMHAFQENDVRLLSTLGANMGVAIENARLFDEATRLLEETEERNAELAIINSVQEGLVAKLDQQAIYDLVGNKIRDIFDAQVVMIFSYDLEREWVESQYMWEKGERHDIGGGPLRGMKRHLVETKKPLLFNEDMDATREAFGMQTLAGEASKSGLWVPLIVGGQVTGDVSIQNVDREHAFDEADVRLLTTLASSMSVALENARLFDETTQRNAELAIINSVQDGLASKLNVDAIVELVGEKVREFLQAQDMTIALYDRKTGLISIPYVLEYGKRWPKAGSYAHGPGAGLSSEVIATGVPLVINTDFEARALALGSSQNLGAPEGELVKSYLGVPITSDQGAIGVLGVFGRAENAFRDSDVKLLSTLASSMGVALENARLFDETTQRAAELAIINSVGEGLASQLDFQAIIDLVGDKVREVFKADTTYIGLYERETNIVSLPYYVERGHRHQITPGPPGKTFLGRMLQTREPVLFGTMADQLADPSGTVMLPSPGAQVDLNETFLGVPIVVGDKTIGGVSVQRYEQHAYDEGDQRLLATIAANMGVALENARLFDETNRLLAETEQRAAELAIINSVGEGLASKLDFQAIIDLVGDKVREIFKADTTYIGLYDSDTNQVFTPYYVERGHRHQFPPVRLPKNFLGRMIETREPLLFGTMADQLADPFGTAPIQSPGAQQDLNETYLGVPIIVGDKVIGGVSVQRYQQHAYDETDQRLLATIAANMGVALENARLFDETAQRNAELAIINSVQQALASKLDMRGIYEAVGDKIQQIFYAQGVQIVEFNHLDEEYSIRYVIEKGERAHPPPGPLTDLHLYLIGHRKSVLIQRNIAAWLEAKKIRPVIASGEMARSALFVPFLSAGQVVGYISLQHIEQENAYDESDKRLLETLAASMSVALENARLFDETNRLLAETAQRAAELAIINSVGEGLASKLDFQAIIDLVGDKVVEIFNADTAYIALYDADSDTVAAPYYVERGHRHRHMEKPAPVGEGLTSILIQAREPLLFGTMREQIGGRAVESPGAGQDLNESYLGVPILSGDQVLGAVSVQRYQQHAYDEGDQRLLATIAANMGVALENARLFDETNQRNAELAIINSVGEAMSKKLDVETVIRIVGDRVQEIFQAEIVGIGLLDEAAGLRRLPYMYDRGARMEGDPVPMDQGLAAKVSSSRQPLVLGTAEELKQENALLVTVEGVETEPVESWLGVPIIVGERVIGVVSVQDFKPHAYQENDVRLLSTLATNMGVALENARLFDEANRLLEESRQKAAELTTVNAVSQALSSELELEALIDMIGDQMRQVFAADIAYVALLNEQTRRIEFPYVYGEELASLAEGEGLTGRVLQQGQPLLINREEDWLAAHGEGKRIGEEALSYLGVPIKIGGRAIGVLSVQSTSQSGRFDESDQRLLNTIAANVSAALRNAHLYQETQQRVSELATINVISEGLLAQQDLEAVVELVGSKMDEVLDVDGFGIVTYDPGSSVLQLPFFASVVEGGERVIQRDQQFEYGKGLSSQVIESSQPLMIQTWEQAQELGQVVLVKPPREELSWLGVPVKSAGEIHGLIFMFRFRNHAFTEADLRLQTTVAANLGVALRNAQLYQETQRRAEEMATLAAVGRDISEELDLDAVLEQIAVRAMSLLEGRTAVIRLMEEDGSLPAVVAIGENAEAIRRDEISVGQGLTGNVVLTGKAELINEPLADPRIRVVPGTEQEEDEAIIFAPMISREKVIGVMGIWRDKLAFGPFTAADLEFSEGLARQAAIAIENARLFEEVARQKEYFESLFVNNPVAVVTVSMNGEVISWNPACQRLFGYTAEEALGRNVDDLVATHPSIEEEARTFTQRFTEELGGIHVTTRRSHKDGHLVDVEVLGLPVRVDNRVMGYIVIYHDITEIERARKAAEEANEAKSAFLANMSHELRTPLNAIIGFTRIVKRKGAESLPVRQVENLEKVLISADHLLGLINTVLDIAKIEAGRMDVQASTFELEPLIDLCVGTSLPLLKPGVELKKEAADDIPPVFSDQDKVKQIVINLLSNAAKFTDRGEIVVSAQRQADDLLVSVRDTGIGISAESLGRIFDEFQQVDASRTREYGGTGLGLSISRSLAQLLGGELTAVSAKGEGSTFTLRLPLHYDASPAPALEAGAGKLIEGDAGDGQPVVLVIDDHPDVVYLLRENLGEAGYRVVGALSGEEGLVRARELKPFAITLDIMMPQKDGWQVLHDLKSDPETRHIPVIMLSIVDNRAMGFRLGAADYLVKPLEEGAVRAALDRLTEANGGVPPRRLLVVDDDPQVIEMVRQLLEESNFVVEAAEDGQAGLERMRDDPPDALLLDLLMPEMDGFTVLEHMRGEERLSAIPVVVLTAKSLTASEAAALQKSVYKIVTKQGLEGDKLIADLRQALRRADRPS